MNEVYSGELSLVRTRFSPLSIHVNSDDEYTVGDTISGEVEYVPRLRMIEISRIMLSLSCVESLTINMTKTTWHLHYSSKLNILDAPIIPSSNALEKQKFPFALKLRGNSTGCPPTGRFFYPDSDVIGRVQWSLCAWTETDTSVDTTQVDILTQGRTLLKVYPPLPLLKQPEAREKAFMFDHLIVVLADVPESVQPPRTFNATLLIYATEDVNIDSVAASYQSEVHIQHKVIKKPSTKSYPTIIQHTQKLLRARSQLRVSFRNWGRTIIPVGYSFSLVSMMHSLVFEVRTKDSGIHKIQVPIEVEFNKELLQLEGIPTVAGLLPELIGL